MKYLALAGGAALASVAGTYILAPWLKKDLSYIYTCMKLVKALLGYAKKKVFVIDVFEATAKKHPKKTMIWFEGKAYSYETVNQQANRVAHFAEEIGLKTGDTVAMMVYNSPEFIWTIFGFYKLGIKVALINTNIRSKSLWHCLSISDANNLIIGEGLLDALESVSDDIKSAGMDVWIQGKDVPSLYHAMDEVMERVGDNPIDPAVRKDIGIRDPAYYIYTSGTTGLPKAAVVTHRRLVGGVAVIPEVAPMKHDDILYVPLPLYHGSALAFGLGGVIRQGSTMVLRKRFSASQFWDDCRKYDVTVILYIGELLRYLTNRPKQASDKEHKVRCAFGNGLRPEVWVEFQERFGVRDIREMYAATEGTGFFANMGNVVGSIGRASPIFRLIYPFRFLKFDVENETAYRGPDGRCVDAKCGEVGLFVSGINDGRMEFDGYKGRKELNEKKILRNCFKDGDAFFDSGDLMLVDNMYNVFFKDRVGDTFRWKGENVSTTEVATVLSDGEDSIFHVNVYGVEVPGGDGRAGMAAMTMNQDFEVTDTLLNNLYKKVTDYLPVYARPLFIRVQTEIQQTSTFKYIKGNLQREGFNPEIIKEPLYLLDTKTKTYTPLTAELFKKIESGDIRL
ncbi:long-chain fatty acid transport protein 2-like [Lineus longissimus]|uniref:long-chain fatty acid transport protein 2-like n=1 Tax=Lineus longissimus TaxID=88925 RepID=UPI002B4DC5F7